MKPEFLWFFVSVEEPAVHEDKHECERNATKVQKKEED